MFNQCWYTYGRDYKTLTFLDRKEPVFSQFEVPILAREFKFFHSIAAEGTDIDKKVHFMSYALDL
jgi:hypothetical protein